MQQGHNLKNLVGTPGRQLQPMGQRVEKGVFDRLDLAISAHQMGRQCQDRLTLILLQSGNGLVDEFSPTPFAQLGEQLVEQLTHLLL